MSTRDVPNRSVFAAVLVAMALVALVAAPATAQTSGPGGTGAVEYLEGDVMINGAPADFGQTVGFGDWVQTGPESAVDIVFDRANIFRLGANTVAKIEIGSSSQSVDLKFGSMSAVFDRLRTLSGRGTFQVTTPTVAGGVRGTTFFFRVLDQHTTYVCTCNGTLSLDPSDDQGAFEDSAPQHSAHYFREVDGAVSVEPGTLIYHSNDGLNALADEIGVTIPWGRLE